MPTIAEEYIREGLERGREEGREEGLEQGLLRATRQNIAELLQLRLSVSPDVYAARLEQIEDVETLQRLHREAAVATDIAEFEEALASLRSDAN